MFFLSTILPWVWLSLGALSGILAWRGSKGALPLMWMFLAMFGGEFLGSWMAHRGIANVWLDRAFTLGITGVLVDRVHPERLWFHWGILIATFFVSHLISGPAVFGLLTPIVIFALVGLYWWANLEGRLQGTIRGHLWVSTGCVGWTWIAVFKALEDCIAATYPLGVFVNVWVALHIGLILCLSAFVWDVYASNRPN